jgi:hypothetical protein
MWTKQDRLCSFCKGVARSERIRQVSRAGQREAGVEPDLVVGTSIGAINSALIAENEPEVRLDRLNQVLD